MGGDDAGIKAIIGGEAVVIDSKYRDAYSPHIPAVILAVNKNPMRFTDYSGGVSRRRVILTFPEVIPAKGATHSCWIKSASSWASLFAI